MIIELIIEIIVEIIFEGIIFGIKNGAKFLGLISLKLITLRKDSIAELRMEYKDSSKPIFIGLGMIVGIIYLVIQLVN